MPGPQLLRICARLPQLSKATGTCLKVLGANHARRHICRHKRTRRAQALMRGRFDRHLVHIMYSSGLAVLSCSSVHTCFHDMYAHMHFTCTSLLQLASVA